MRTELRSRSLNANKQILIENQTESNAEVFALNSSKQYNPDSKPVNTKKNTYIKLYRNLLVKQQTTAPKLIENNLLIILILTLINYIQKWAIKQQVQTNI